MSGLRGDLATKAPTSDEATAAESSGLRGSLANAGKAVEPDNPEPLDRESFETVISQGGTRFESDVREYEILNRIEATGGVHYSASSKETGRKMEGNYPIHQLWGYYQDGRIRITGVSSIAEPPSA